MTAIPDKTYDVIVAGGGPAGMIAAIASARNGAHTLLIERSECLGGTATSGLLCNWGAFDNADRRNDFARMRLYEDNQPWPDELKNEGERIIKGIPEEMLIRMQSVGAASKIPLGYISINPEYLKIIADEMVRQAGAEIIYGISALSAERTNNEWAVDTCSKSGQVIFKTRQVIDASGDADLARFAGAEIVRGRQSDGTMQPPTLVFMIGNANVRESDVYLSLNKNFREATGRKMGCWTPVPLMPGVFSINNLHSPGVDGCSPWDVSHAVEHCRREAIELTELFRRNIPGCENVFLIDTAPSLGIRETVRIVGDYTLTEDDVLSARKFPDGICRYAHNIDVHLPDAHLDKLENHGFVPAGSDYHVPYKCMLPKNLDDFLVAGRTISATHFAAGSARVMPCCMAIGQAAGTAAALSVKMNTTPRKLPVDTLIGTLLDQGVCL
ncbi:FAD-dependent oxidoreductase [bacterium]|nr:FAD-dependent oxidoreductase [bacterium]